MQDSLQPCQCASGGGGGGGGGRGGNVGMHSCGAGLHVVGDIKYNGRSLYFSLRALLPDSVCSVVVEIC